MTGPEPLSSWYDDCLDKYKKALLEDPEVDFGIESEIDAGDVFITVVVPAFNEEQRLTGMLEEAVDYLEKTYSAKSSSIPTIPEQTTGVDTTTGVDGQIRKRQATTSISDNPDGNVSSNSRSSRDQSGWEILIIDDGSKDSTHKVAEEFSRRHILPQMPRRDSGPWSHRSEKAVKIPAGSIKMIRLEKNRGKGGAVTHGLRHAQGKYIVFADADGASDFKDLGKLVTACQKIQDKDGRGLAVGSRAHLVGSEVVVKRSKIRNFLMHSFHLVLRYMTPEKTAQIKDTQCGFKLMSRPCLPWIVPHMHIEGWIFDVELLMLAEWSGIPVTEVAIGWKEVQGSKLNIVRDSIGMAWGLAMLRFCWTTGIYRR